MEMRARGVEVAVLRFELLISLFYQQLIALASFENSAARYRSSSETSCDFYLLRSDRNPANIAICCCRPLIEFLNAELRFYSRICARHGEHLNNASF